VQWCVDNGIYVSVSYSNQGDLLSILNELLALYGGYLTDYDGIIHFGIVTGTDDPVRTIDNSHLVAERPVRLSPSPRQRSKTATTR
jgi:hypothetical protein